jgi:site-specific DNA recombinase
MTMDQLARSASAKPTDGAVLYLRVSTEEQVDNYSLETQQDICTKEAQKRGLSISQMFREEGRSAKTIKGRPALIEMLDYCRKNRKVVRAVIVYRLDRISRQTADYLAIRKKLSEYDIVLISASEPTGNSPTEKFVETMLAGFAQMDNDVRSERTKNGLRARFLAGLCNGPVPTGYVNQSGYALKDPETFEVVKEAWLLMASGTKTLQEIADYLNKKGLKSGHGGKKGYDFRPQTVSRLFHNKFYAGKIVSPKWGEEVLGQHTPMITEA